MLIVNERHTQLSAFELSIEKQNTFSEAQHSFVVLSTLVTPRPINLSSRIYDNDDMNVHYVGVA